MNPELQILRRIRWLTSLFILGLVLSGATAIPLAAEVDWIVNITGAQLTTLPWGTPGPGWARWLLTVQAALHETGEQSAFLFYGTDWLAFGHFVIAIAFIGALRDPARNVWLFTFGMIACALVVPFALVMGGFRGIPLWWRLIDCLFGMVGFVPLWMCRCWTLRLQGSGSKE